MDANSIEAVQLSNIYPGPQFRLFRDLVHHSRMHPTACSKTHLSTDVFDQGTANLSIYSWSELAPTPL